MCLVKDYICYNEGLSLSLYECTAGKLSIVWGRNLTDNGISEDEARLMLKNDLDVSNSVFGFDKVLQLSYVLIDMMFNLGKDKFMTFKKMIAAVQKDDYHLAAKEILDSKYARNDVPNRAERNAYLMRES